MPIRRRFFSRHEIYYLKIGPYEANTDLFSWYVHRRDNDGLVGAGHGSKTAKAAQAEGRQYMERKR